MARNKYICKVSNYDHSENRSSGDTLYVESDMNPYQVAMKLSTYKGNMLHTGRLISYDFDLSCMDKWNGCEMEFNDEMFKLVADKPWDTTTVTVEKINHEFVNLDELPD